MRIAVVIEPLDGSRQVHSEAGLSFTLAGEALSKVFQNVEILHFSGIRATKLLDGLSREDWDALVFASNSIRHRDGAVWSAFEAHGQKISRFVEAGGGLLVLHQFDSNLGSLSLPDGLHIGFGHRDVVKNSRTLTSENEDELLLNFPFTVNLGEEFAKGGSQLADLLSWMECDFPEGALSKVLSMGSKQTVLARSSDVDVHRVVLSALPLDWHGAIKLLGNALTFVASGPPRQIVWSLESRPLQLAYNPEGVDIGVFELIQGHWARKPPNGRAMRVSINSFPDPLRKKSQPRAGCHFLYQKLMEDGYLSTGNAEYAQNVNSNTNSWALISAKLGQTMCSTHIL